MNQADQQIANYIQNVCEHIKFKEIHSEIKEELRIHIEEIAEGYMADGIPEEEAVHKAIQQMGDPNILGKQFHQTYKPRTEWSLLGLVLAFIGVGLLVMYSIEHSQSITIPEVSLFMNKTLAVSIGITIALFLFFFDYRKLKTYSHYLYLITLLMMILTILFGPHFNGRPMLTIRSFTIDFINLSPYLFVIALGGMLSKWNWNQPKVFFKLISLILVPSLMYFLSSSTFSNFIFIICFIVLFAASQATRKQKQQMITFCTLGFGMTFFYFTISAPYRLARVTIFLNPYKDPLTSGWHYIQSIEAISSAGLWGHGISSTYKTLPYPYSDFVFTYFIYAFGWVSGAILFGLAILFIIKLSTILNQLNDLFGSLVIKGMVTIFSIKFLWSMLMSFSLVPVIEIGLPFISHGGLEFVIQMMAVGIVLSIYRRKDLIMTSSSNI